MGILQKVPLSQSAKSGPPLLQNASQKARGTPLEHEQMRANLLTFHLQTQAPPPRIWLPYSSSSLKDLLFVLQKVISDSTLPSNNICKKKFFKLFNELELQEHISHRHNEMAACILLIN